MMSHHFPQKMRGKLLDEVKEELKKIEKEERKDFINREMTTQMAQGKDLPFPLKPDGTPNLEKTSQSTL